MFRNNTLDIQMAVDFYEKSVQKTKDNYIKKAEEEGKEFVEDFGSTEIFYTIKQELKENIGLINIDVASTENYEKMVAYINNFEIVSNEKETIDQRESRSIVEGKCAAVLQVMKRILPDLQQQQQQQEQQQEQQQKDFVDALNEETKNWKWERKGKGFFSKKIPEGIKALREIFLDTTLSSSQIIEKAKEIATKRLGKMQITRNSETEDLYNKIIKFGFKKPEKKKPEKKGLTLARSIRATGRYGR